VVAFLILVITIMTIGFPTGDVTNEVALVDRRVEGEETPASKAGIRPDDRIVGVGGERTRSWREIRSYIRSHGGEPASFTIERGGRELTIAVTPGRAIFDEDGIAIEYAPPDESLRALKPGETTAGFLGIQPEEEFETKGLGGAVVDSGKWTWEVTKLSARGIVETFSMVFGGRLWNALTGEGERDIDEGPLGLVGAGRFASESVERGRLLDVVGLIVGFTIFVGMMNLLPLPPLDGGHLAVVAYEAVTGRVVDLRKLIPIAAAVISFFVLLFVAVLYLDLARPIKVPF
ncbi:MAG: site-2 protease family protein, partial [Actinomycetota bacterium]|nr:site-2 protease family protein [Actinomycetota bacterium]